MRWQGGFLFAVLFMCLVSRQSTIKPPDQEHSQTSLKPQDEPPNTEKTINKDLSELDEAIIQESVISETPTLLVAPSLSTEGASVTSEISEQDVTPTVAPATPNYDVEPTVPASYSVVHDAGGAVEDAVPVPEPLKSSVDTSPPVSVSNEPTPNPDPAEISEAKVGEDSITSVLRLAEEENKPKEDEMPTFDEFKRQMLKEEEEKIKQQSTQVNTGMPTKPKVKKPKKRKQTNYASIDCGAKVLNVNSEASNAEAILTENRDIYMLNPCSVKIFFVVELCDTAHVKSIDIANFELFSSMPESFRVYVSNRYPTREWTMLGTFQATDQRDVQSFPLDEPVYAKYLKVEMLSHFGSEHYCPLSLLRVYGISMMEELEDQETEGQEEGEVPEGEAEDEPVQVLPADPSAKEDEMKKKGILEKAADTVISFVKKFVGSDGTNNGSADNTKVKAQQSIVTLIEREEGEENATGVNKTTLAASSESLEVTGASSGGKSDSFHTAAPTPCEVFVQYVRHPSFDCFNGSIFYCKKYYNLTITAEPLQERNGASSSAKQKVPIVRKLEANDEEDKQNTNQGKSAESASVKGYWKMKKKNTKERGRKFKRAKRTVSEIRSALEKRRAALGLSKQGSVSATPSVQVASVASAAQPSMPKKLPTQESSSSVQEHSTPSVLPVNYVTTKPQPDNLVVPLEPSISTIAGQASVVKLVEETAPDFSKPDKPKSKMKQEEKPSEVKFPETSNTESGSSPSSVSTHTELVSESQSAAVMSEASTLGSAQSSVHSAQKKLVEGNVDISVVSPAPTVQSECTNVNSIELIDQNSPHVDILETKLTDDSGKEGTAELHQPDNADSVKDKPEAQQKAAEAASADVAASAVPGPVGESSPSEQRETSEDKTEDKESEKPADSGIIASASSESGIVLENEPPRQAPPVVSQALDMPRLASVCSPDLVVSEEVSSDLSSRATQQVSMSLGLAPGSGQKESVFMRLSNRIKALEQNLTLSTLYMEQINQRYRKNLDELLKNFDKKITLLSNATKKAEVVINSQKEQISELQEQLNETSAVVSELKHKMTSLNEQVMERHVIGLVMEVLLILALMLMFRRYERNRASLALTPGTLPIRNGTGPPRQLHNDAMDEKKKGGVREQPEPEIIRAASLPTGAEERTKDSTGTVESKKKKHKRRSKCLEPALASVVAMDASLQTPPSVMTHTAGLLFSSARGILDAWIVKKPTGSHSEPDISPASNTGATIKGKALVRARSLNGVPEHVGDKAPPPAPPPPPRPTQNGWGTKVPTPPPPTFSDNRRHSASYGVHAPKKTGAQHSFAFSGKYGKQVKVG